MTTFSERKEMFDDWFGTNFPDLGGSFKHTLHAAWSEGWRQRGASLKEGERDGHVYTVRQLDEDRGKEKNWSVVFTARPAAPIERFAAYEDAKQLAASLNRPGVADLIALLAPAPSEDVEGPPVSVGHPETMEHDGHHWRLFREGEVTDNVPWLPGMIVRSLSGDVVFTLENGPWTGYLDGMMKAGAAIYSMAVPPPQEPPAPQEKRMPLRSGLQHGNDLKAIQGALVAGSMTGWEGEVVFVPKAAAPSKEVRDAV